MLCEKNCAERYIEHVGGWEDGDNGHCVCLRHRETVKRIRVAYGMFGRWVAVRCKTCTEQAERQHSYKE